MEDIVSTVIGGIVGEEIFRNLSKKRYFPPALFIVQLIIFQVSFVLITIVGYCYEVIIGREVWNGIKSFLTVLYNIHFVWSQPYAVLLFAGMALGGTLSYMWHRKQRQL